MDACSVHWARGGVMLWLEVTAAASVVPSTRGATRSAMRRGDGGWGEGEWRGGGLAVVRGGTGRRRSGCGRRQILEDRGSDGGVTGEVKTRASKPALL